MPNCLIAVPVTARPARRRRISGEWTPGLGSANADRMRRDRRERPRRGGQERDNAASRKTTPNARSLWPSRYSLRSGAGTTSRRSWRRAGACAWRTGTPVSTRLAVSSTCATCVSASPVRDSSRSWTARLLPGVRSRRSERIVPNSRTIPHVDDAEAWSAVCFRVRPRFRRRRLMHGLLDGAIEHARASGAIVIEGYPVDPEGDRVDQTDAYVGTVGLFEAHGFARVVQTAGRGGGKRRWLVRRRLT